MASRKSKKIVKKGDVIEFYDIGARKSVKTKIVRIVTKNKTRFALGKNTVTGNKVAKILGKVV